MLSLSGNEPVGALLGGKYRLGPLLGRGGMGSVFEARHERTGRSVAVKILNADFVENAEVAGRFLREARVVAELKHPNVVDVLDMDEEPDGTVYMVLELLVGESLGGLLQREQTLTFERAAEVLLPVMRALAFAHAHGVVHRDLKPENIFLHRDAEGRVVPKLLDFGIASALGDESRPRITQTGCVMGTPEYMSPEQTLGVPERIGAPSDVWSMGVLWYEALTGARPFGGATPYEVMAAVTHAKFARPSALLPCLPLAVTTTLDQALLRNVGHRHPDMGAFIDALQAAIQGPLESAERAPTKVVPAVCPPEETTDPSLVVTREPRRTAPSGLLLASLAAAFAGVVATAALLTRAPSPTRASTHVAALAPAPAMQAFLTLAAPEVTLLAADVAAPDPPASPRPATRTRADESVGRRAGSAAVARPSPARNDRDASRAPIRAAAPARAELPRANAPLTDYDRLP